MKTKFWTVVIVCAAAGACLAQDSGTESHRSNTQIIDFILNLQEKSVVEVAEVMPAEKYNFAPTGGEFKGVRTFGEQLKHIAADNYLLGAGILGEKPPVDVGNKESGATSLHAKPEIMAYLKDSFAYMHRAAAAIDDAKSAVPTPEISPWPAGTATRLGLAIEDCVHTWDHYGQLVEYLRMNGIIPPESRPAASQQGEAQSELTVSQALDFWITKTQEKVVPAAQAMPEEKYSFAPTAGEFAGVRTFAQQVKHLAACNYRMAAYMLGQTPTPDQEAEIGPETVRSKAEIMEYLKGSFAATHRAVATLNEGNLVTALAAGPSP
ncbi:MAG TPA: DinB family protein, partial [Terriglobales bacterium]|nr:DinB family protein [Terriglobales bacterium]